jgi:hypothetical protein
MKNVLLICVAVLGLSGVNANAHEEVSVIYLSSPRAVVVRSVSPHRVMSSFYLYSVGVGKRMLSGVGKIVTAPFKQPVVMPKPRKFIYTPARWYYRRGSVMEVFPLPMPKTQLVAPAPPSD